MIDWIIENLVSIIIVMLIAIAVVLSVMSIIRNRKKGCSCGCEGCMYSDGCSKAGRNKAEE
jgi:hypothetical protein